MESLSPSLLFPWNKGKLLLYAGKKKKIKGGAIISLSEPASAHDGPQRHFPLPKEREALMEFSLGPYAEKWPFFLKQQGTILWLLHVSMCTPNPLPLLLALRPTHDFAYLSYVVPSTVYSVLKKVGRARKRKGKKASAIIS